MRGYISQHPAQISSLRAAAPGSMLRCEGLALFLTRVICFGCRRVDRLDHWQRGGSAFFYLFMMMFIHHITVAQDNKKKLHYYVPLTSKCPRNRRHGL